MKALRFMGRRQRSSVVARVRLAGWGWGKGSCCFEEAGKKGEQGVVCDDDDDAVSRP